MVTVGLVRELTAEAAHRTGLGVGAKLVEIFSYKLTTGDVAEIVDLSPDILLPAGGTDGGNVNVILCNAGRLADSGLFYPVVISWNCQAVDGVARCLEDGGIPVTDTGNVMPEFEVFVTEPARAAIHQIFVDCTVHAKGLDRAFPTGTRTREVIEA